MYRPSNNPKQSRVQHLASLSWILDDDSRRLTYSATPKSTEESQNLPVRDRALSLVDVESRKGRPPENCVFGSLPSPTPLLNMSLPQILSREQHDSIINKTTQSANTPILIITTSSTPRSQTLLDSVAKLSQDPKYKESGVQWYEMPMIATTTDMIKFGIQNCPVVILMRGVWAETLLGVRGIEEVERGVDRMLARAG